MAAQIPTPAVKLDALIVLWPDVPGNSLRNTPAACVPAVDLAIRTSLDVPPVVHDVPILLPNIAMAQSFAPATVTVALFRPEVPILAPATTFPTAEVPWKPMPYPRGAYAIEALANATWILVLRPVVGLARVHSSTLSAMFMPPVDRAVVLLVNAAPVFVVPRRILLIPPPGEVELEELTATPTTSRVSLVPTVWAQEKVDTAVVPTAELTAPVVIGIDPPV